MTDEKRLLPEDPSDIEIVPDEQREPWLTDEQKNQPRPPSKADMEAMYERMRQKRRERSA